jgi:hypothetical protein
MLINLFWFLSLQVCNWITDSNTIDGVSEKQPKVIQVFRFTILTVFGETPHMTPSEKKKLNENEKSI